MIQRKYRIIVGRNEPLLFPVYDEKTQFPAKVDTGAYRSAIHCADIKVSKKNGKNVLTGVLFKGHPCSFDKEFPIETENFEKVVVANSFGHKEERYEVKLRTKIGPLVFNTTFTLADRSKKLFPILLGRKALKNRFLVDISNTNVDRMVLKETYGKDIPDDEEDLIEE